MKALMKTELEKVTAASLHLPRIPQPIISEVITVMYMKAASMMISLMETVSIPKSTPATNTRAPLMMARRTTVNGITIKASCIAL